jgi:Acyltransferase family
MRASVEEAVRATPATRDRYVDFLRAFSIMAVLVGHWLIGVVYWQDGVIGSHSAIGMTPWLWILTWFLMVMPLFFFVGGFANMVTLRSFRRRNERLAVYLQTRLMRLLRPSLVFVSAWAVVQLLLRLADIGTPTTPYLRGVRPPGATIPFGPLWFLVVYAAVILVSPVMAWLHERFGVGVVIVMTIGAVVADALGFAGGLPEARWANLGFVFLIPHQLGFLYADGGLRNRGTLTAMAIGGLAALLLLTNPVFGEAGERWFPGIGHYPKSLLGNDVDPMSNAYPPTLAYLAVGFWSIGALMLLREPMSRWLRRARPWRFTVFVNSIIMTLFLWHMTAFLLAVLVLWPLGFGQQGSPTLGWWLERPLWVGVAGIFLAGIVAIFGRFERPRTTASRPA